MAKKEVITKHVSPSIRRFGPTGVGLLAIPIIIHPIDNFVDFVMNKTIREWWN